ncbi:MAG: hypothetical protein COY38_00675 [Candidatus Aenigmarchaeota archaeon CG_4_10_14_0_8_um_filter_37_24]|nr:MAG: hypothetical protein AUJ50_04100 [Candidatus Aenigmarchaeota archaeon CG1_02_38_14]PIV69298.1 MAG: hypothetical protein COS07_01265 [Candidatus Aenigmarchaeota archaeon CG01_land_8_20_14_3_00_37_9]PIW41352.1 MAG: hypothetical protein COW21_02480 [Candidatus Aenigmarchaeota archaeon CG15_BIG_FIL_POST_REV_8_21_14_020_37_27]PIX50677.1 MAG: hypothetical protein COZ52_02715 [Candidatus Aenigmarchaeota archaeon CG_4_8_14_3_um_filter_37_24]PIY36077.1 MAG: hypothetical protein COZ04_01335 [Cand
MKRDPIIWVTSLILTAILGWIIKWLLDSLLKTCEPNMGCAYGSVLLGLAIGVCMTIILINPLVYNRYKRSREEVWQTQLWL